ncbi:CTD kinase subunit beta [Trichomonascus vanleenenianus]|uniref:Ctk2p n=1 Tax=Trichomonascus vanleenenianus TaxID=2268995 RepID=UPI003ECBA3C9
MSPSTTPGNEDGHPSLIKLSRPFLTTDQIEFLRTNSNSLAVDSLKWQAFSQLWALARDFKFPIKTFATCMILYNRTLLFNNRFHSMETALACLFVASKIEDTPKKTKELLQYAYNRRIISRTDDEKRLQLLGYERQILETTAFDFRIRNPHQYVIKICKTIDCNSAQRKSLAKLAWVISTDALLTDLPLKQPAHTIAIAAIVLSAKVQNIDIFPFDSDRFYSTRLNVNRSLLELLDFYIKSFAMSMLGKESVVRMDLFYEFRKGVAGEVSQEEVTPDGYIGLVSRDTRLSDKGTVRYVLDWELDHVKDEQVS